MPVIFIKRLIITIPISLKHWVIHYFIVFLADFFDCLVDDAFKDMDKTLRGWVPDDIIGTFLWWHCDKINGQPFVSEITIFEALQFLQYLLQPSLDQLDLGFK